jgi:hypothetical protein
MNLINPSRTSFVQYVINQEEILLSENAIATKYFSLQFKMANYCINTGDKQLDQIGVNFVNAPLLEFGTNFAHNQLPYVETFVSFGETINTTYISQVHHFFYLNEVAMEKFLDVLTFKKSPDISITMFLSTDNLSRILIGIDGQQHSHSHDASEKSLVITSTDFAIHEDLSRTEAKTAIATLSHGAASSFPVSE